MVRFTNCAIQADALKTSAAVQKDDRGRRLLAGRLVKQTRERLHIELAEPLISMIERDVHVRTHPCNARDRKSDHQPSHQTGRKKPSAHSIPSLFQTLPYPKSLAGPSFLASRGQLAGQHAPCATYLEWLY